MTHYLSTAPTLCALGLAAGALLVSTGCVDSQSTGEVHSAQAPPARADGVLVRWRGPPGIDKSAEVHARLGGQVVRQFASVSGLQLVASPTGLDSFDTVAAYAAQPEVLYAEPNWLVSVAGQPSDPGFENLWGLHNEGQTGGVVDVDIDGPEAWDLTTGEGGGAVVVIDTGVDHHHEDLAANMAVNPGEIPGNGIDDDGNGYVDDVHGVNTITGSGDPMDDHSHGTHVAGTIGAVGDNGIGVTGVSWDAELLGCKFMGADGRGSVSDALACLDWAHHLATRAKDPVDIIATNNSWGGSPYSQALEDAIEAQQEAGILFVAAAGNAGVDLDASPSYPAAYFVPNVLTVAATDDADQVPSFSNTGRHRVHLGAPGFRIVSTVPGDAYASYSGTSMAAPHVTGLIALLHAQDPSRPWYELRNLVLAGGTPTDALAGSTLTGRRLRAVGSGGRGAMTCADQVVTERLRPVGSTLERAVGDLVAVYVLHIDCAQGRGPVSATVSGGSVSSFTLQDDGGGVDAVAGDGISVGTYEVGPGLQTITLPGGDEIAITAEASEETAPTVAPVAFGAAVVEEGDLVQASSAFEDPDGGPWTVEWDFSWSGDFRAERTATASYPGAIEAGTSFVQDGPVTVAVRVTDSLGQLGMGSGSVDVVNVPPVVDAPVVVGEAVEGSPLTLTSAFSDPGVLDAPWRAEWDFDAGTQFAVDATETLEEQGTFQTVAPAPAEQGSWPVAVRVWDEATSSSPATSDPVRFVVEVRDVDPAIASAGVAEADGLDEPVWARLEADVASGAVDPQTDPLDRFEWDFDADGTIDAVTDVPVVEHLFEDGPASGERTVRLVAWDEDSSSAVSLQVAVANVAPAIDPVADGTAREGSLFAKTLGASDPGDVPTWALLDGPGGMTLSSAGALAWTPTASQCVADPGLAHAVSVQAADDDGGVDTASFTVTCLADEPGDGPEPHPPGEVVIVSPELDGVVFDENPVFVTEPATDPDSLVLDYEFEIHADATRTDRVGAAVVAEGDGEVVVTFDAGPEDPDLVHSAHLADDADYWWRVRATDGELAGPWSEGRFRYDPVDAPPTAPTLASPLDGDAVATPTPELIVGNATDPDSTVRYDIALYADPDLSTVVGGVMSVAEGAGGTTAWTVAEPLVDDTWYWWQATAVDDTSHTDSAVGSFLVDLENEPPTAPVLIDPAVGAEVGSTVTLVVGNAHDPEGEPLDYLFELDATDTFGSAAYRSVVRSEEVGETTAAFEGLSEDTTWWWRVRAQDGSAAGEWVQGTFFVSAANEPPSTPVAIAPIGGGITAPGPVELLAGPAMDPEGEPVFYTFTLEADGVERASGKGWIHEDGTATFTTPDLEPGTSFTWTVTATDPQGATGPPATGRFRTADLGHGCSTGSGAPGLPGLVLLLLAGLVRRARSA